MKLFSSQVSNRARMMLGIVLAAGVVTAQAQDAVPDYYKEPGLFPNRTTLNQHAKEHIDPFTGALQIQSVDISIPGRGGFDLNVVRSYNSPIVDTVAPASSARTLAGLGWNIHFGRVLRSNNTNPCDQTNTSVAGNPVIDLPDGRREVLYITGSTSPRWLSMQRWKADCIGASSGLAVYSPDGTRYDMTQVVTEASGTTPLYAWYVTKITDRNGNYATINYSASASPQVSTVSTSDGRNLSFSYLDSGVFGSARIASITASGSRTWNYTYQAISGVAGRYRLTKVTPPTGGSWNYTYKTGSSSTAGVHLLETMSYPQGGAITYGYGHEYFDTQSNPLSKSTVVVSKSASGGSWSFSYAPGNSTTLDTTTVSTPAGTITYKHIGPKYTSNGTVWKAGLLVEKKLGSVQTETYQWNSQKISSQNYYRPGAFVTKVDSGTVNAPVLTQKTIQRDGTSYTTNYSNFDSYGNPKTISETGTNGGSRTTNLTYNVDTGSWLLRQVKDETIVNVGAIGRNFDSKGNLTQVNRFGVVTNYTYTSYGDLETETDARSKVTSYGNYNRGIPQTESHPEGVTITRVVNTHGNVVSETNGEGKVYGYAYDSLDRITTIDMPIRNDVGIGYNVNSTTRTLTRGAFSEVTAYDNYGRPDSITRGGVVTALDYDALGRKTYQSYPGAGIGTSYGYDILGRVTSVNNAGDGTSQAITYLSGNRMQVRNERNLTTTYAYRSYGDPDQRWVMSISTPEPNTGVTIGRNGVNQITSVAQGGVTRGYSFNGSYLPIGETHPETGTTTLVPDAVGNIVSRQVGAAPATGYVFDGLNRLTNVNYPAGTPSVSMTYYKTDQLQTLVSSAASRAYYYDGNGKLELETLAVDGQSFSTSYGYDGNDSPSSVTYPRSGRVVDYAPDVLGRPTQAGSYVTSVAYWPNGQPRVVSYGNGTQATYEQHPRQWPRGLQSLVKDSNGYSVAALDQTYGFDGVGNVTSVIDAVDSSYNRSLAYDNIDRLRTANGPWGNGGITYDGVGNITNQTFGSATLNYSYNGTTNRLSSVSGYKNYSSFGYDAYGNVTGNGINAFQYNDASNLTCVNCSGSAPIQYAYDGKGMRVMATRAGVKTYEIYSAGGKLLAEYTPSQADALVEYIYLGAWRVAQRSSDTKTATTVSLAASPNPVLAGVPVTLTATVTGTTPSGTVGFYDGTTLLGQATVGANGIASISKTFNSSGNHSLTAQYSGDATNGSSRSAVLGLGVNVQVTTTTLTIVPNPTGTAQAVVLKAVVTGNTPSGTVLFSAGSTQLGTVSVANGEALLTTYFTTDGNRSVTATYSGDNFNASSTSAATNLVVNAPSSTATTWIKPPKASSIVGVNQLITIKVAPSGGGNLPCDATVSPCAYGTVRLMDDDTVLAETELVAGTYGGTPGYGASFIWTPLVTGPHTLTVDYIGTLAASPSSVSATSKGVSRGVLAVLMRFLLDDQ